MEEKIKVGDPHEPFSDYIPKALTADELKLVGVTILGPEGSLLPLRCDLCGWVWHIGNSPASYTQESRYWVCPQDLNEGELSGLTQK